MSFVSPKGNQQSHIVTHPSSSKSAVSAEAEAEAFLRFVFGDTRWQDAHVCGVPIGAPKGTGWGGGRYLTEKVRLDPERGCYVSQSLFMGNQRIWAEWQALVCVALDDVGTKVDPARAYRTFGMPAWRIESSPGNWQWGYRLREPETDLALCNALFDRLGKLGLCDPGSCTAIGYRRLPFGRNAKHPGYRAHGEIDDQSSEPTTVRDMLIAMGITPEEIIEIQKNSKSQPGSATSRSARVSGHVSIMSPDTDPLYRLLSEIGALSGEITPDGLGYELVGCPWTSEHTGGMDTGRATYWPRCAGNADRGGYKCFHSHCAKRGVDELRAWAEGVAGKPVAAQAFEEVTAEEAETLDAAAEAHKGATQQTIRGKVNAAVASLNTNHMVVCWAGKTVVVREDWDTVLKRKRHVPMTLRSFRDLHMHNTLLVLGKDKSGTLMTKSASIAEIWLKSPARRQFDRGMVFDPRLPPGDNGDLFNLWTGFSVMGQAGDWSLLRGHMFHVVCGGDIDAYLYLESWLALAVQRPWDLPEVAVVMRGDEGVGKGLLARTMGRLFGQHGMHISDAGQLTGRFNGHLQDCVFLFADEAFYAGDKAHVSTLKRLITEPTVAIEHKGFAVTTGQNFVHLMIASNSAWIVPASLGSRRFFAVDVLDTHKGDFAYFKAINDQLDNGGLAAMLYDLLNLDLSGFQVRDIPITQALLDQRALSLSGPERWWLDVLMRGYVLRSDHHAYAFNVWLDEVSTDLLDASYRAHIAVDRRAQLLSRKALAQFIKRMGGMRGKLQPNALVGDSVSGVAKHPDRAWGYRLGDLGRSRRMFDAATKLNTDWDA